MDNKTKKRRTKAEFSRLDFARVRLSDVEMQRLTGATRTTVARWRTGQCPPPPAAIRLARLAYYGDLAELWPDWAGFQIGRDGLMYLPGFKYGFRPVELGQWYRLIHERHSLEHRLRIAERDLAAAQAAQEAAEARAEWYRQQLRLEARHGLMLARVAA